MTTVRYRDDSPYQEVAGYARAVRRGARVEVSGTTASTGDTGTVRHPGDTYEQAADALRRALSAAGELGAEPGDVVRTRMLLAPGADWRQAARAHRELLGEVEPANTTLYVHALVGEDLLVEVELAAQLPGHG